MKKINQLLNISNISRISHRKDINGLRAIAVLAVVFYHAEIQLFKGGWLGVDIFFVISGYLISNIIISELNDGIFSFKNFYIRRVKRILPALFFTLLISIPLAYFFLTPKAMEEFVDSVMASLFFYANYYFMDLDFYITESTKLMPLLHTWSLAIEEQYYLLFPLFSVLVYRYLKRYFTPIFIFLFAASLYLNTLANGDDKFYLLQYRLWELLLGVLVMILSSNLSIKHLEKIGLPLLLTPLFLIDDSQINITEPKLITLLGVSLIIFSNTENTMTTKLLSLKPLTTIGLSSYSIYLLHQPLFAFYRIFYSNIEFRYLRRFTKTSFDAVNDTPVPDYSITTITFVVLILLLLLLGNLSYKYVEIREINMSRLLTILLILLSFVSLQKISTNVFNNFSDSDNLFTQETVFSDYDCWNMFQNWDDSIDFIDPCFVDNNRKNTLVVLGDSSTAAYSKSIFQSNVLDKKFNYLFLSSVYWTFFQEININDECDYCILSWLKENSNSTTILLSLELHRYIEEQPNIYYSDFSINNDEDILFRNIKILSSLSRKLIILEPFPTMSVYKLSPREILLAKTKVSNIKQIYIPYQDWINNTTKTNAFYKKIKFENNKIDFVKTSDIFCRPSSDKCIVYEYPDLYYLDNVHLTTEGANLVIYELEKYLK